MEASTHPSPAKSRAFSSALTDNTPDCVEDPLEDNRFSISLIRFEDVRRKN